MPTTTVVRFPRTTTLSIELPRNLGTLTLRPIRSSHMEVTSPGIVINERVYSFSGSVVKINDRWYFQDKVEIGVKGGRPSPKTAEEALKVVIGALNISLEQDPEFRGRLAELHEQERIRAAELERMRLISDYGALRRDLQRDRRWVEEQEDRTRNARQSYVQSQAKLVEFMDQHPEIVEEVDQGENSD